MVKGRLMSWATVLALSGAFGVILASLFPDVHAALCTLGTLG